MYLTDFLKNFNYLYGINLVGVTTIYLKNITMLSIGYYCKIVRIFYSSRLLIL